MNDSKNHQTIPHIHNDNGLVKNFSEFLGFDHENYANSRKFLIYAMKNFLLFGADKVLLAQKSKSFRSKKFLDNECDDGDIDKFFRNEELIDVSKALNCPSKGYNQLPLNLISFFSILVLRSIGFQVNLFTTFLSLPIWLSYTTVMFLLFPFQTLTKIQAHLTKRVLKLWADFYFTITSYIISRLKAKKNVLNLAIKLGWAFFFYSIYVFFVLFGLLIMGFLLGWFATSRLVEKPMEMTKTINFDYTKASPVAFVPITSYPGAGVSSGVISRESVENNAKVVRAIPHNHKLGLTVSLTLPESEYNRKLGVFQVRVEFLSSNGKVTASSTHPCMLRFKSHPIHLLETAFKTAPLMAGFQSESQTLAIKISDFTEGHEPTACLKVVLEQRAEYLNGAGIPQIYAASIALESELPQLKKILWCWRRTVYVWVSIMFYLMELVVVLVLFRPVVMPRGRPNGVGGNKISKRDSSSLGNKISWC